MLRTVLQVVAWAGTTVCTLLLATSLVTPAFGDEVQPYADCAKCDCARPAGGGDYECRSDRTPGCRDSCECVELAPPNSGYDCARMD